MNKFLIFTLIVSAVLLLPSALLNADESENTEYAYGTVVSIDLSTNIIVVREQNYDNDTQANVTYCLSPDTVFENVNSLKEIIVNNDVDVSYLTKNDGKKVVKFISVYNPELEGEEE
ncbi:MAG: hypothetical protein PHI59_01075 [Candidatus Omnitrophica bacterium]|nr:hypothetical protein [Candidatus Omnitrophota bacterium]